MAELPSSVCEVKSLCPMLSHALVIACSPCLLWYGVASVAGHHVVYDDRHVAIAHEVIGLTMYM